MVSSMTSRFQIVLAKDFLWQLFLPDMTKVDLVKRQYILVMEQIFV